MVLHRNNNERRRNERISSRWRIRVEAWADAVYDQGIAETDDLSWCLCLDIERAWWRLNESKSKDRWRGSWIVKCFGLASSRPSVRNRSKQFIDSSRAACVYPDFSWLHPAFLITPAAAAGRNRQLMKLCRRLDQPLSPSFPALLPPLWRRGAEIQKLGLPAADSRRALSPYRQSATNRSLSTNRKRSSPSLYALLRWSRNVDTSCSIAVPGNDRFFASSHTAQCR